MPGARVDECLGGPRLRVLLSAVNWRPWKTLQRSLVQNCWYSLACDIDEDQPGKNPAGWVLVYIQEHCPGWTQKWEVPPETRE